MNNDELQAKINKVLSKKWKYSSLKKKQEEVVVNFINKKDIIAILPTGYGKSLCYLLPPLVKKKVIFIVSPLISLMEDQKEKLVELDIPVSCLHSNNPNLHQELDDIRNNKIKIVYMSPEYLVNGKGIELATYLNNNKKLKFLAIDESHCISGWGHDFRDSYLHLYKFRELFPKIPILAVTATATTRVIDDISRELKLRDPIIIREKLDRPNIYIKCIDAKKKDKKTKAIDYIRNLINPWIDKYKNDKIIIYMNSRKECDNLSDNLNDKKYNTVAYHAGMDKSKRENIQTNFNKGKINVIISTVAFGMGIDQIVRCVLIIGAPKSIEDYYQQIGRAGRDGEKAEAILFFQSQKIMMAKKMNEEDTHLSKQSSLLQHKKNCLDNVSKYFYSTTCRRRYILNHFDEIPKFFCCNNCDNCCEYKLKDYTRKIYNCLFSNTTVSKMFTPKEINMLMINNVIDYYDNFTSELIDWKTLVEVNKKTLENLPNKYRIKIKNI
uniref:Helicase n=1 Tax=Megaviridae environmental sample TaxID=1737588 RepID=A0A5J6VJP5_9VIRU|nr:MAG: helicase [Megaviridae environmental sample]